METTFRCLGVRASAEPCGHRRPVSAFEFDDTGRTYTASRDGTVKCWDGRALRELSCVDECGCWVNDLAFIGDNTSATTTTTRLRKRSQTIAHNFFSFLFFFCVCVRLVASCGSRGGINVWRETNEKSGVLEQVFSMWGHS